MSKIAGLANLSKTAAILIDEFASRERHRGRSDLRKMFNALKEEHAEVNKDDFMRVFEELQKLGLGSIIIGRGTSPTRFVWNYNLKEIGLAAQGRIPESHIHSIGDGNETYQAKSAGHASPSAAGVLKTERVPTGGDGFEVLVISPSSAGIARYRVPADRAELMQKLLNEFAEPV